MNDNQNKVLWIGLLLIAANLAIRWPIIKLSIFGSGK